MSHFDVLKNESLKSARQEVGISKHVPITHFDSPTILETNTGMVLSVIKVAGVPFDTEQPEILNNYKRTWHRALTALDEHFCIYTTIHRRKENISLKGDFSNDFAHEVDRVYHSRFQNYALYFNDIYITIIYKGLTTGKMGKGFKFLMSLSITFRLAL